VRQRHEYNNLLPGRSYPRDLLIPHWNANRISSFIPGYLFRKILNTMCIFAVCGHSPKLLFVVPPIFYEAVLMGAGNIVVTSHSC
jgi:hypothetical protein